jgi:hypothetical protein
MIHNRAGLTALCGCEALLRHQPTLTALVS